MLTILAMLMKRIVNFQESYAQDPRNQRLAQIVDNYYDSNNKILPVIITLSNTSLPQAFLWLKLNTVYEQS